MSRTVPTKRGVPDRQSLTAPRHVTSVTTPRNGDFENFSAFQLDEKRPP
jgi:hypothetical protein